MPLQKGTITLKEDKPMIKRKEDQVRDEVYYWSLELVKEGKILQAIFLTLATWNFAYFRYHMRDFDLYRFKKMLENLDFSFFKNTKFVNTDLNNEKISTPILNIYKELSEFEGIKYVGASKIMHLMCPDLFVMWDTKIRNHYGRETRRKINTRPEGYLEFLRLMKEEYQKGKFDGFISRNKNVTVPRAIDLWNIENIPDKKDRLP